MWQTTLLKFHHPNAANDVPKHGQVKHQATALGELHHKDAAHNIWTICWCQGLTIPAFWQGSTDFWPVRIARECDKEGRRAALANNGH